MNSLTDEAIISELYAASEAGARITLIVRGICCLRPGVKGMSENIEVRSVLGRFLEHSRIFNFETKDSSVWLMGSADLMPRNLDNRLEVVVPVEDPACRKRLAASFALLLEDNTSWRLESDGSWVREAPGKDAKPRAAQDALMRSAPPAPPAESSSALAAATTSSPDHRHLSADASRESLRCVSASSTWGPTPSACSRRTPAPYGLEVVHEHRVWAASRRGCRPDRRDLGRAARGCLRSGGAACEGGAPCRLLARGDPRCFPGPPGGERG